MQRDVVSPVSPNHGASTDALTATNNTADITGLLAFVKELAENVALLAAVGLRHKTVEVCSRHQPSYWSSKECVTIME